ncbi:AraC family transcriptional regulator [Marinicella sp. W31]|uniref:AraC family transcriptional regulator n=1 Tax=Marinicella sp. W31 TaxID=3023713 RepID=UPI0037570C11
MTLSKQTNHTQEYHQNGNFSRREICIVDQGFAPHRHDTYTIALTIQGVQSFHYQGSRRHALPGDVIILHPDELHDGQPGTEEGFTYRCIDIQPQTIQKALGKKSLPFVKSGISPHPNIRQIVSNLLAPLEQPLQTLEYQELIQSLASCMQGISTKQSPPNSVNVSAVKLALTYIEASLDEDISLQDLEKVCGYRRRQLCRDFRHVTGTSPYRYLLMRRLDKARSLIMNGQPLSQAAVESCFSDQSHFNRHFKKTYGMTPKRWLQLLA